MNKIKPTDADKILYRYWKVDKKAKEIFFSIPRKILLKLKTLYEKDLKVFTCGWNHNRIVLMIERIEQTLNGEWKYER